LKFSVPELVEQVLRRHGLEGVDFEFRLEKSYSQHELITQWRESDLQFIRRLLSEVGIWFRTGVNDGLEPRRCRSGLQLFVDSPGEAVSR
jgi:uncharacterized protein involved in type VI secretion and phage assembly